MANAISTHRQNHYATLEVSTAASLHVIRAAYRCLAQRCHPDKNAGCREAHEKLVLINQAYSILSDGPARMAYDKAEAARTHIPERRIKPPDVANALGPLRSPRGIFRLYGFRPLI